MESAHKRRGGHWVRSHHCDDCGLLSRRGAHRSARGPHCRSQGGHVLSWSRELVVKLREDILQNRTEQNSRYYRTEQNRIFAAICTCAESFDAWCKSLSRRRAAGGLRGAVAARTALPLVHIDVVVGTTGVHCDATTAQANTADMLRWVMVCLCVSR